MTEKQIQEAIVKSLVELRKGLNMGIPEIANALGISVTAWRNYEAGKRVPRSDDIIRFFTTFGVNPMVSIQQALYPENFKHDLSVEEKRKELIEDFENAPDDVIEQMYYIRFAATGSDFRARLHKQAMEDHLQIHDKIHIAKLIVSEYTLEQEMGELINTEYPAPNVHLVVTAIRQAHESVMADLHSYSTLSELKHKHEDIE